ncbi:hypothetical protein XENOCAPTIV_021659 [Xenoophorus captivus]|uniref:Uncharacterized protein n=1 Tax=Xenoophorus captivus TaxID=1517983 RepID=A0ABV0SB19_9TELE
MFVYFLLSQVLFCSFLVLVYVLSLVIVFLYSGHLHALVAHLCQLVTPSVSLQPWSTPVPYSLLITLSPSSWVPTSFPSVYKLSVLHCSPLVPSVNTSLPSLSLLWSVPKIFHVCCLDFHAPVTDLFMLSFACLYLVICKLIFSIKPFHHSTLYLGPTS